MKAQSRRIMISSARKFINIGALSRLWNLVKKFQADKKMDSIGFLVFLGLGVFFLEHLS